MLEDHGLSRKGGDSPEAATPVPLPSPESRRRGPAWPGYPVTLSDGRTWHLADGWLAPILDEIRDRLYERTALTSSVLAADVLQGAWVLLLANYELADDEIAALLDGVDDAALSKAVLDAILGPEDPPRTYTRWAMASLHANDLDPAKIPPPLVHDVLDILVRSGRTVPQGEYVDAMIAAGKRRHLLGMAFKLETKGK